MKFLRPNAIAAAIGGTWVIPPDRDLIVNGVGTDSRTSMSKLVFVALRGAQHDGHDHLTAAERAGAALLVVSHPPQGWVPTVPTLLVADTLRALQSMGRAWRAEVEPYTIAITGSSGKTTTRRLLHAALQQAFRGTSSPKSFNNDVGVPLTMLSAQRGDDFLLLELGMSHPGEISALANLADPDAAIITMVGRAHLGGVGSLAAIAREKASVADDLPACAALVVNGDDAPLMSALHDVGRCDLRVVTFGVGSERNVRLVSREQFEDHQAVTVRANGALIRFTLRLPGAHNATNAMAALAMALDRGVSAAQAARGLAEVEASEMRMVRERVGAFDVYNDAYNANPDAVAASLRAFAEVAKGARRRVVVLGDMLELGEAECDLHAEVGRVTASVLQPGDEAWFIGRRSHAGAAAAAQAGANAHWVEQFDEAASATIGASVQDGDAVLLKGSRGSAVERVLPALRAAAALIG